MTALYKRYVPHLLTVVVRIVMTISIILHHLVSRVKSEKHMTQNGTYWLSKVSEGQIEEGISTKGRINFSIEQFATILFFFSQFSTIGRLRSLLFKRLQQP